MNTDNNIQQLLDKYFAAETTHNEEQILADYFASPNVAAELLPYTTLFNQIKEEKQIEAPAHLADKLKATQQQSAKQNRRRTLYISIAVAASIVLVVSIGMFRNAGKHSDFEMYVNGKRINDPVAAINFTTDELNKALAPFNKGRQLLEKPANTIERSLQPLQRVNNQLQKVRKNLQSTNNDTTNKPLTNVS